MQRILRAELRVDRGGPPPPRGEAERRRRHGGIARPMSNRPRLLRHGHGRLTMAFRGGDRGWLVEIREEPAGHLQGCRTGKRRSAGREREGEGEGDGEFVRIVAIRLAWTTVPSKLQFTCGGPARQVLERSFKQGSHRAKGQRNAPVALAAQSSVYRQSCSQFGGLGDEHLSGPPLSGRRSSCGHLVYRSRHDMMQCRGVLITRRQCAPSANWQQVMPGCMQQANKRRGRTALEPQLQPRPDSTAAARTVRRPTACD